ncbi:MAG: vitamin B12-dependent ribonucleotide reductase [Candidatus Nomurabacteria bacterium]|jgi:ribonucleoside-diphosphate reductase alpha chain|nr:vitamin B12-dependent ribonucleotide reductase [Candidatus Nomurabacteria bacterium]
MARKGKFSGLKFQHVFSTPGADPYAEVEWEIRDVVMKNWRDGSTTFEQKGVEFPKFWSLNASNIVASKYFRGELGTPGREHSLKQLIDRVVKKYVDTGDAEGYFASDSDRDVFENELKWMLLHQVFSFNSPVWFNVGTNAPQQVSACFILSVDDTMESILNWYTEEGKIFKRGSGAGVNLSRIRGSHEGLSSGGSASGPVSFMRGADASAGTIASGGATRRAAKMVVLDIDHPDIEAFIETKVREEAKIRALKSAGFDMDIDGKDIYSVQYQNANNSIRVSDEFMKAVEAGGPFALRARTTGEVVETVDARELFRKAAEAAWACADPGIQYDDTINAWHTIPKAGKITASNPCSEYMSIDNSSCNLASINLLKFLGDDGKFDIEKFRVAVEIVFTAMDISITFGDFPTEKISANTKKYRQLGIGYANLGALLMASGLPYDSKEGQAVAAAITSLMSGAAYRRSAEIAEVLGAYAGFAPNAADQARIVKKHSDASLKKTDEVVDNLKLGINADEILFAANREWEDALKLGGENGWRNSQVSLLAPTGTIAFMMDCDTTGIEPDFALVKYKKLVGGGSMQIVNQTIPRALKALGYDKAASDQIVEYIAEHDSVVGAPGLKSEDYAVFDCAVGERSIEPMGHVRMMAAVQPFLSGAISKTVNMPESATVDDVAEIYLQGWKMGLKAIAIYRDNCKAFQPLSNDKKTLQKDDDQAESGEEAQLPAPARRKLPSVRPAKTYSYTIAGADGYITAGSYPDDGLGEVFLKVAKQGSTLAGLMDAFSIAISVGLQYGVPLSTYVKKFVNMRFDPAGMTNDADIRFAQSPVDYIFRRLALDYLPFDERASYGIYTTAERTRAMETGDYAPVNIDSDRDLSDESPEPTETLKVEEKKQELKDVHSTAELMDKQGHESDAPICMNCGVKMRPAGSCYICELCGSTSGCS